MAIDRTPPEFKHYLGMLKHALQSIASCADEVWRQAPPRIFHGHIRNIRKAADGLELLAGQIKEPEKTKDSSSSSRGMTYEPENEKS